jgi:predicted transcriptional regulator
MVRRSRLEIYFDVLNVIDRGIDKPTRIMYKTNLSWNTLQDIFATLLKGEFIREEIAKNSKRYYITEKGKRALHYHLKALEGFVTLKARTMRR